VPSLQQALLQAAGRIGTPLTLGGRRRLFSRSCRRIIAGLAELGLIAGCGMAVAYMAAMTLLPATDRGL